MLEWYVLAVIFYALSFDQHRSVLLAKVPRSSKTLISVLFDISAWIGGIATLVILTYGFFIETWWWPLIAMVMGTVANYCGRRVIPLDHRWVISITSTCCGSIATIIFFKY